MACFRNKTLFILACLLFFSNIFAWQIVWDLSKNKYLEVSFFNVGQGDAIFIETPGNHQILVDGGPTPGTLLEKLGKEMPFWDRTIDLVILSHPEKDHLAGLLEVLKRYKIKNILWTGIVRDTDKWREWQNLIKKEGAEIKITKAGDRIILKKTTPAIFIDILNPTENVEGKEFENSNDTSVVASLVVGENSFLFTGDISESTERGLIRQVVQDNINTDVLKIAHHGSKYSTSEDFLEITSPELAVISVGENNYGHPTQEVLAVLQKFGIETLITKEVGDIKIFSDGKNLKLITNN